MDKPKILDQVCDAIKPHIQNTYQKESLRTFYFKSAL